MSDYPRDSRDYQRDSYSREEYIAREYRRDYHRERDYPPDDYYHGGPRGPVRKPPPPPPPPNPQEEPPGTCLSAIFGPVVAAERDYYDFFHSLGFTDIAEVTLYPTYGFAQFTNTTRVDMFIEKISGCNYRGQAMFAHRAKSKGTAAKSKTLHLRWKESGQVTERGIYKVLSPYGFIRRITSKGTFAFVEFDTANDSANVINIYKRKRDCYIDGCIIQVSYARSEHKVDPSGLAIPLADMLPESQTDLWWNLQKQLQL